MNKTLTVIGSILCLIWAGITWITKGLPLNVVSFIDTITLGLCSNEVAKLNNGFFYDVRNSDMPTLTFLCLFFILFILYMYAVLKAERSKNVKEGLGLVIVFSVLLRLIAFSGEMIHENDIYRYVWDAKQSLAGVNPYKFAPSDLYMYEQGLQEDTYDSFHDVMLSVPKVTKNNKRDLHALLIERDANEVYYDRIGHWQVPTIYPPVAEILFMAPVFINGDSLLVMKFFFVLIDIAVVCLIIALLKQLNMNPVLSLVYGWSPLVIMQLSNSGHYDSIPIFFTLLAIYFCLKQRAGSGMGFLALATLSKFFSAVLFPILARPFKWNYLNIFALLCVLLYVPYFIWGETYFGVFKGLGVYNEQWAYNSSIYAVVYTVFDAISPALTDSYYPSKIAVGLLFLTAIVLLSKNIAAGGRELVHKCFWAVGLLFLCSPVGDPWYFCWCIPFLCVFRYRSWLLLSGLLVISYANFHTEWAIVGQRFLNIPTISWIIYAPFYVYLGYELRSKKLTKIGEST